MGLGEDMLDPIEFNHKQSIYAKKPYIAEPKEFPFPVKIQIKEFRNEIFTENDDED